MRMVKTLTRLPLVGSALVSGWLLMPLVGQVATSHQSQVKIEIAPNTDDSAVAPVDPDDPSQIYPGDSVDPGNVTGTGSQGNLTIDYLSNLKFEPSHGHQGPIIVAAQNQRAMVQVSNRRTSTAGWALQVKPSQPSSATQMLHATIDLGSVEIKPVGTNVSSAPKLVNQGHLTAGQVNNVLVAAPKTGLGTWLLVMNRGTVPTTLQLHDATIAPGNYTGTLTWLLTNAPS
ncbi:WxL domain-containing protein [Lactobacillus sp. CBA3606]|uniref:WxL domain-containing protein n=1 Tax=Lactobacillus sp. CBA3606 TaxID=2099789 RepID=UPI000CFDD0E9|nr:WxL domain-containing protein [Lactobacillus sp. CBA3606]AVK63993.1 WxL domain-containing protein [Lactobacillus sp. CBA3606]